MFPTITRGDAGMMHSDSETTGSCMEEATGGKVQEQGGVYSDNVANNLVNIRCLQDALWIHFHHPYIWQHFDAASIYIIYITHPLMLHSFTQLSYSNS